MIISIVGPSKSGKTTLLTKLIPLLKDMGLRVVVVKHHAHGDFEIDKEGKDSWKLYNSGADVVIASSVKMAFIRRMESDDLNYICENYLKDYDLILTEGFNKAGKDRIVILKDPKDLEFFKHGKILAVICDSEINGYRTFKRDQVREIARFIHELITNRNS